LWQLNNLRNYMTSLAITPNDKTVCILARNEGIMLLLFYDCVNQQSLSSIYAGPDPQASPAIPLTLTAGGAVLQVLWRGLGTQRRWTGIRSGSIVIMGNGYDPNMALETTAPLTFRPLNDQMRPLIPYVAMADASASNAQDATIQAGHVLFTALEVGFQPTDADPPYRRDYGNYVQVSVVQSGYSYFSSQLNGEGTLISPYIYTVLCPMTLPTEDQLCNFIQHDPNSQGVVSAQVIGTPGIVTLFPPASLSGGVAQFADADVFAGPFAAAAVTYCKKGTQPGTFSETMPSPIQTCQMSGSGRLTVTINQDTAGYISRYDTIRIYVADMAQAAFGLAPNYYASFLFALEVPNGPGTYVISPSMLQTVTPLNIEVRSAPPCSMFVFDAGRLIMSGNSDFPMRVWFTKASSRTQLVPEGIGIFDYLDFPATVVGDAIVALGSYRGQSVAYSKHSAYPYDSTGTTKRFAISTGAINSRMVKTWTNGAQYYIGRDYNIYTLTQPVTDARSDVPDFNLPAPQIGNYLQQYCDTSDTHFAHSVVDTLNKNWWFWLRNTSGAMIGFVYNFESTQLTGPFSYPQFMCAEFLEDGDTRMVGMDIAGNIFFMDVKSLTTIGEPFTNTASITLHSSTDPADLTLDGFGIGLVAIGGVTKYVRRANLIRIQSPWLNYGNPAMQNGFLSFSWQCIQGSSGLMWIVAKNDKNQTVVRYFGDVANKPAGRVNLRMTGNFLQFMILVMVGDDLPFALRNVTAEVETLGSI
jgi:hypothetical protein